MNDAESITFQVETSRILEILSAEIYDSPQAFLRENVQNAYDGILMRCTAQDRHLSDFSIEITLQSGILTVEDSGIGMTEETLRQNYWKAGSSGKRNELAQRSGVIGSFGIGAMANFGVCETLRVETRHIESDQTLISSAIRSELQISQDCIKLERVVDNREPGTKIVAQLNPSFSISQESISSYLSQYVSFLPLDVRVNGQLISQKAFEDTIQNKAQGFTKISTETISSHSFSGILETSVNSQGMILARVNNILRASLQVIGEVFLTQNGGQTLGFRNLFGLAPIPVSSIFSFGGFINLSVLHPTAGREALSRESIQFVAEVVIAIEKGVSESLAGTEFADRNTGFQQYILNHNRIDLAKRLKVQVQPAAEDIEMGELENYQTNKTIQSYQGRDPTIIKTFANEQSNLVNISQGNPRRGIQLRYLSSIAKIEEVPDTVTVEKVPQSQLTFEELMFVLKLKGVLMDDYLLADSDICLANISHGVMVHLVPTNTELQISISQNAPAVTMVIECCRTAPDVFSGFVKDYVREHIYPQIRNHIPSSTRQGRDALFNRLKANRELFRYEEQDFGKVESLLADYLSGIVEFGDVIRAASSERLATQRQQIGQAQVGSVETIIPDIIGDAVQQNQPNRFEAVPPIFRPELVTDMKVLTVSSDIDKLNGVRLFIALSGRATRSEGEFLKWPHTTRVIWGAHKIIYIFTDQNDGLSLYYEIELKDPLTSGNTGGELIPTTTVITRDKIFIPVPSEIESAFHVLDGAKEFYVRFDTLLKG